MIEIKENGDIDFGSVIVPTSWDEVPLKMFQDIERFYSDKEDATFDVRECLSIFTNLTLDEVNALPMQFTEKILEKLSFVQEKMPAVEPTNKIVIDNVKYQINYMEKLKTGEFVATDGIIHSDRFNYAAILAVLCRKPNEVYDSKFEAEMLDDRIKMFEEQPITKVKAIVDFFINCYIVSETVSQLYSKVEDELNRIQQNIDSSQKIGAFRKRYLKWRMKKLRKSLKSSKST